MNLFSPILRLFGIGGLSGTDKGAQYSSGGGGGSDAGITVSDERALQLSAVWDCVQKITNSVCSLPINFYEDAEATRPIPGRHALKDLLHNRPNPHMKPRDFRKAITMQLTTWCNAYAEITWLGNRPVALVPLRPGRMTPYITDDNELQYHYQTGEGVKVYSKRSIMHFKGFGPDGIVGLDRASYARNSFGLSVSADVYASKQFANGGRSGGGHLMFDQFLTKKQREQAYELYDGLTQTAYNKGKLRILEGGIKYVDETLNPDTMQMIETRKMNIGEIARFFGVPDVLIGGSTNGAWPASFEQQLLSFLTFTLQDYLDEWETTIRDSLLVGTERERIFVDHDITGFIKMDSEAMANFLSRNVQNGIMTRNESRRKLHLPAKENGDELTVQVNLTNIEDLPKVDDSKPSGAPVSLVRQ